MPKKKVVKKVKKPVKKPKWHKEFEEGQDPVPVSAVN